MKWSIDIDESEFRTILERKTLGKLKKGLRGGMKRVTLALKAAAVPLTPKRTGNLARSENDRVLGSDFDVVGVLYATASYAKHVHEGTGIYGPLKRKIEVWCKPPRRHTATYRYAATIMGVSVKAKRTVTRGYRSGGGQPYLRRSDGMQGTPFFWLAYQKLESQVPWIFKRGVIENMD